MTRAAEVERSLPANLDAERAVLGAVLLHAEAYDQAAEILAAGDFYRDGHRRIFLAMGALVDRRTPLEFVTLREELARTGELDEAGGPAYVSSLADGVPRAANVAHYAAIVREKARLREAIFACNKVLSLAYEAEAPAAELAEDGAERLHAIGSGPGTGQAVLLADLIAPGMEALEASVARGQGGVTGLTTGFPALDDLTAGLQAGDLILVAARTSQGKTALAMQIARALGASTTALVFSLEMSRGQLFMRLLASEARVDSHRIRIGKLSDADWARIAGAMETLRETRIVVDDTPGIGVREILSRARQVRGQHGLGAIVVDYIQLLKGRGTFDSRAQEVGAISRGLKAAARELDVPVIALSQLSRQVEAGPNRKARLPVLADLSESSSLENDADVVLLIHRPEPKAEDEGQPPAEIIVAKQRSGPIGTIRLLWSPQFVRFENLLT